MTTHYETLGVARDASPDDIKQAWRRASSTAHPDKGGTDAGMAAVNRAYEVLGDPERRARYDAEGTDAEPQTMELAVRDALMMAFKSVLMSDEQNVLEGVRRVIDAQNLTAHRAKANLLRQGRVRGCHQQRAGHLLVAIDKALAQVDEQIAVAKKARELLDTYTTDEVFMEQHFEVLGVTGGTYYFSRTPT